MAEFALIVPLLMLILLAILQFGILFRDYLAVTDAVRAGARKAAVSRLAVSPTAACTTAVEKAAVDLGVAEKLEVKCESTWKPGEDVRVEGAYPYSINLLGIVVKSGFFLSVTTERVE